MRLKYVENGYEILEACQEIITIRKATAEEVWSALPTHQSLHLELGTGMGDFLLGMAAQYPKRFFLSDLNGTRRF